MSKRRNRCNRNRRNRIARAAAGLALTTATALGQETLFALDGPVAGAFFGTRVVVVRDLDGDGVPELAVGASSFDGAAGTKSGAVWVWSGRDGALLWKVEGTSPKHRVGNAIADVGDHDGDGVPDLALGVPDDDTGGLNAGALWIVSGTDGTLHAALYGSTLKGRFGRQVAGLGDVDGDGTEDLVLATGTSAVALYSGASLTPIAQWSSNPLNYLGIALAGLGDVDGDGVRDFIVGSGGGFVHVRSGATGTLVRGHQGHPVGFYGTVVAGAGDLDADGRDDYLVGAPFYSDQQNIIPGIGRAYAYSGRDGAELFVLEGGAYENLGSALAGLDDVDGDGHADFAVSSGPDPGGLLNVGRVTVHSGRTGGPLWSLDGTSTAELVGQSIFGGGDFDGDGVGDLAIGVPGADAAAPDAGRVLMLSAAPTCGLWCSTYCDCAGVSACGNIGPVGAGCASSAGAGARLTARGTPSVTGDTLWLTALDLPPGRPAVLMHSAIPTGAVPFGDGTLCLAAPKPLGMRFPGAVGGASWGPGLLAQSGLALGQSLYFQALYRDPGGPCGTGFNATNGLQISAAP